MNFNELSQNDLKTNLVDKIINMDLEGCSYEILNSWKDLQLSKANQKITDGEYVGYTLKNVEAFQKKITKLPYSKTNH